MQLDRFTQRSREAIEAALRLAADRSHTEASPEHLLWALLDQPEGVVTKVVQRADVDLAALRTALGRALEQGASPKAHENPPVEPPSVEFVSLRLTQSTLAGGCAASAACRSRSS